MTKRSWKTARRCEIFILIFFITFSLILFMFADSIRKTTPTSMCAVYLTYVGGGLLGASIALFFQRLFGFGTVEEIKSTLEESLKEGMTSEESKLDYYRKEWHHYHVTYMGGKKIWRYKKYDFTKSPAVGRLIFDIEVENSSGYKHPYRLDCGARGNRFIIVQTRLEGQEEPVIQIYPLCFGFSLPHFGVSFMKTWDSRDILTCSIMSVTQLVAEKEGSLSEKACEVLDKQWTDGFLSLNDVFPGIVLKVEDK